MSSAQKVRPTVGDASEEIQSFVGKADDGVTEMGSTKRNEGKGDS